MDDILARRKTEFFKNLVLLGLDPVAFEKKHGIPFHKDMFDVPNKKGFEVVTHFLFSKLSAATGENYDLPWPLLNKEHDRMYQKTCYAHLMNFSQENLVKFPRIVPSLLSTSGTDRFYEVYLAFSNYVIYKIIIKNGNINLLSQPAYTRESFVCVKETLQLATALHMKRFRDSERLTHSCHLMWTTFSKNLQECLQKLKHLLKTNEELIRKNRKIVSSLHSINLEENFNLKKSIEKSLEYWKPVIKQGNLLETFFSAEETYWQYLASEVGENAENEFLNGQDYNICINENLPESCRKELEKVGFSSCKENGKLSVLRFMELLLAYLSYMAEIFKKDDLSQLHKVCFVEDASSIQDDLCSINNLNKKLTEEIIPEVEESITKIKSINHFDDPKEALMLFGKQFCAPLPVLNFNPEAVKGRASNFNPSLEHHERIFQPSTLEINLSSQELIDSVFLPKGISSEESFCSEAVFRNSLKNMSLLKSPFPIFDVNRTETSAMLTTTKEEENTYETNYFRNNVPSKDLKLASSKLSISALDDIDLAPSFQSRMRASWLLEESLNKMTLSDVSFDD